MKRFSLYAKRASERIATMHEHPKGEWVRYEDYAKIKVENDTLGEANKWLTYGIGSWCHKAEMAKIENGPQDIPEWAKWSQECSIKDHEHCNGKGKPPAQNYDCPCKCHKGEV